MMSYIHIDRNVTERFRTQRTDLPFLRVSLLSGAFLCREDHCWSSQYLNKLLIEFSHNCNVGGEGSVYQLIFVQVSTRKRGTMFYGSNMAARWEWDVCKCYHLKTPWAMSERKISKALRKDRESTVSAVDIKSLTSSESTFSLRPLKVGEVLMIL